MASSDPNSSQTPVATQMRPSATMPTPARASRANGRLYLSAKAEWLALSSTLVKAVMHASGQIESPYISLVQRWNDRSLPIVLSLVFFVAAGAETLAMFLQWAGGGFGALSDVDAVIRITVATIVASAMFVLDVGLGILRLIPAGGGSVNVR